MVKLGTKVRDTITGFEGTTVARTEWLFGCTRVGVQSSEMREGKPIETQWFDEASVEVIKQFSAPRAPGTAKGGGTDPGGVSRDPAR